MSEAVIAEWSWEARERERQQRLRQQLREQDRKRYADPDRNDALRNVWVVYVWCDPTKRTRGMWKLAGFDRRQSRRRKPRTVAQVFARLRRRCGLSRDAVIKAVDLQTAAVRARRGDTAWQYVPPAHYPARKVAI